MGRLKVCHWPSWNTHTPQHCKGKERGEKEITNALTQKVSLKAQLHGSGSCSNLNYVMLSYWNLIYGKTLRAMYTILECSILLGGSIRARTTCTVNISWTLALWSGLLLRARHGFSLCR